MEEKKDIFFVGIEDPEGLRAVLLGTLKEIIESLGRYERFKEIREERAQNIEKLRKDVKELSKLISELNNKLPKTGLNVNVDVPWKKDTAKKKQETKIKAAQKKAEVKVKEAAKKPESQLKERTQLERLEAELDDIEAKLSSLS